MAKAGRPITNRSATAKKHRDAERARYQKLPQSKKTAIVQERDKEAQRRADEKRSSSPQRKAYKKADAKATRGVKTASRCANCGSTKNLQRHVVNGKYVKTLCNRCNTRAIGKGSK